MKEKKEGEIYSYMLRFNKELALDCQALEKISRFCYMTGMTIREAILLILATADVSALHDNILSLNVVYERNQETRVEEKNFHIETEKITSSVPFKEADSESRYIDGKQEKEAKKKFVEKNQKGKEEFIEGNQEGGDEQIDLGMFNDIFDNF